MFGLAWLESATCTEARHVYGPCRLFRAQHSGFTERAQTGLFL
jgi:hypothetical protein